MNISILDAKFVRASIPPAIPDIIKSHIEMSLRWLEAADKSESPPDPRLEQSILCSLLATIELYNITAETARKILAKEILKWTPAEEGDALRKENRMLAGAIDFILDLTDQEDVQDVAFRALKEAGLR